MTERNVSIRIGVTGKEDVKRAFDDVGKAGQDAFNKTATAMDAAGTAADRQVQRLQRLAQAARQAGSADEAQRKFSAFIGIGAGSGKSARDSAKVIEDELNRIDELARLKTQQIGANFQSGLAQAFRFDATGKSARDSAAVFETELSRLDEIASLKAQQIGANFQSGLNAAFNIGGGGKSARDSAVVFEEAARAADDLEARTRALRAQIDPLGAAQARLNAELAEATSLFKAGAISQREMSAAHAVAQSRFNASAKAIRAMGDGTRLASFQIQNLGFQLNDVVVGLASGQKPLTVLTQQGLQIAQVFSGTGLGVGGALKEMGRTLVGLISPTALLVGATAAVGATALLAFNSYIISQKELEVATAGVGRSAGATVDQLNRIADAASDAGQVSVAAAREMEIAFLRTGRIGVEQFAELIAVAKNYAATTGQDVEEAVQDLGAAFADPAKGIDTLNAKVGGFDDRTRTLIKTLASQNNIIGAQRALLDGLKPSLIDASEATTTLGRAWDAVARAASNAFNALGGAIDRAADPTLADRLTDLQRERSDAISVGGTILPTPGAGAAFVPSRPLPAIDADIANVEKQISDLERKAVAARADAEAARISVLAGETARALTPGFSELQTLKEQQAKLAAALDNPAARAKVGELKQVEAAFDAVTRAVITSLDPAEKARRLDELEVRALEAKTPAQKASIAQERVRIELSGKTVTTATAEAEATRAGEKARAQATRAIIDQSLALAVNTRASLDVADAYLKGADAAQLAEVRRKALTESVRNGVDVQTRMNELLRDEIAQTAVQGAKSASDVSAQADAQRRLNDAVASGALTSEQAQRQMQAEQALRPLIVALSLAEGDAKVTLTRIIDALRGAYSRLNGEQARSAALQQLASQKDQIELIQRQIELSGQNQSQASIEIAQLQAKQQLIERGISAASAEGQAIIANAGAIERLNQELSLARSSMQELEGLAEGLFSRFGDLIADGNLGWESWADAGRAAIADLNKELLKLALLNPLRNELFGQNLPTLSSVGGLFGSFFGSGSSGSFLEAGTIAGTVAHGGGMPGMGALPTRAVDARYFTRAPRLHRGAFLAPDEVPAILQTGERVLNRDETRRFNARQFDRSPIINFTIQTPDPTAFRASKGQIAASLSRAVQSGMRGL